MALSEPPDSPRRWKGEQLNELYEEYWPMMQRTRTQATKSRRVMAGLGGVQIPTGVQLAGAEAWLGDLPHKRTNPMRVKSKILAQKLQVKRPVTAAGYSPQSVATRIEQPLDAIMRDRAAGFPDQDVVENLLFEGLAFSVVMMNLNNWQAHWPTLYAPGSENEFQPRYRVDSSGKLEGDAGFSGIDLGRAERLRSAEMHDAMARNLPFRQKCFSIRECAPIWGSGPELEGLIVRTYWSASELLKRRITITNDPLGMQLYPLGALQAGDASNATNQIEVTEAWLYDEDRKPYLVYGVNGQYTWKKQNDGKLEPAVIDLSKLGPDGKCALTRLPISCAWGMGWSSADLDMRAMGYTVPFEQTWRNLDSMQTSLVAWVQWRGFPALIERLPPGEPDEVGLEDDEAEQTPDFQSLKITRVRGEISEVATQGIAPGVIQSMQLLSMQYQSESAGNAQQNASSGFQASLGEGFEQDALSPVHDGRKQLYSDSASFVLEGCKLLADAYGENVRVYQIADVLLQQKRPSSTEQILEVDAKIVGSSFWLEAVDVVKPGDNPVRDQQNAAMVKEKLMSTRQFLEQRGDESPEATKAEIDYETILESPEGVKYRMQMLQQYVDNTFTEQLVAAINQGQAHPQTGLATGYAQGLTPPPEMLAGGGPPGAGGGMLEAGPQAAGGMTGMQVPNPAAASAAGIYAGGLQQAPAQRALAAGGAMPAGGLPGAG